jgi:hypothetical protein
MSTYDHIVKSWLLIAALAAAIAACGGKEKGGEAKPADTTVPAANAGGAAGPADRPGDERRPANAVTTTEAGAELDLQYELAPRPLTGQPFTIDLMFVPRLPADSLEAQISATPGLRITSAESVRFDDVQAGERYTSQVLAVGDAPGLYYVGVVARMATKVQTDARSFSVPVVVGTPPGAESPAEETGSTGAPAESPAAGTAGT